MSRLAIAPAAIVVKGDFYMKRALINPDKCQRCNLCNVDARCPQKAIIREEPTEMPWVDFRLCRGCMKCKQLCENGAVLEEIKPCNGGFATSW